MAECHEGGLAAVTHTHTHTLYITLTHTHTAAGSNTEDHAFFFSPPPHFTASGRRGPVTLIRGLYGEYHSKHAFFFLFAHKSV